MANNSSNEVKVNKKQPEEICSQNSDLGWEELYDSRVRAENTKRTTAWGSLSLRIIIIIVGS